MADTKSGREKKGRNKMAQLDMELASIEVDTLDADDEPPEPSAEDAPFLTDEVPDDLPDDFTTGV